MQEKLKYINYGLNAQCEADILPIYYGDQLANGAAYNAYRLKRFIQVTGDIAVKSFEIAGKVISHITSEDPYGLRG